MLLDPVFIVKKNPRQRKEKNVMKVRVGLCVQVLRDRQQTKKRFSVPSFFLPFFFCLIFAVIQRITKCACHRRIMGVFF